MGDVTREFRENVSAEPGRQPGAQAQGIDIVLNVPMAPRGKGRARASKGGFMYTPKKTRDFEKDLREYIRPRMPDKPIAGLLRVDVLAFIQRPKRLTRRKDPDGPLLCGRTPDCDNILKACLDSIAVYFEQSDACVAHGQCVKFYTERTGKPRIMIRIRSIEPGTDERETIHRIIFQDV